MKKQTIIVAAAIAVVSSLGLTSCKKETLTPDATVSTPSVEQSEEPGRAPTYYSGIVSNNGYPANGQTEMGYYSTNAYFGQSAPILQAFGGLTTSTIKGCAATKQLIVFAYKAADGVTYLNFVQTGIAYPTPTTGQEIPVLLNGSTLFNYPIEEIEVDPISKDVYAVTRVGNAVKLYRIDGINSASPGTAVLMTYPPNNNNIFGNPLGNGYKWGSITFVPNGDGTNRLVFASESTVYASLGIVTWHFNISGTSLTVLSAQNRTYSTATSGIAAGTGINTVYFNGKYAVARNNGNLYELNLSANNLPATQLTTTPMQNSNDFGHWVNQ
jgi:hypothetical protein